MSSRPQTQPVSAFADPFARWGLTHVINVCGTKTGIGASKVKADVIEAVKAMLPEFVAIDELQGAASKVIATATGAEAGCVTDCAAAGVCQSVAAAITGADLAAIERLPDCAGRQRRIAMQMGHMINYGGPTPQMITVAGGEVVPLGTAAQCEVYHLREALAQGCAAALYVVSHHTVREGELSLALFIDVCREYDTPVIVDMASEYDLRTPIQLGASAVVYSGHKFMSGITSGIVAGTTDLIRAVYLQSRGIGRMMKVGKESIVGAMATLELWQSRDAAAMQRTQSAIVAIWQRQLAGIAGVALELHGDWTGNPITRLKLTLSGASLYAWELAQRLADRNPAIIVRDDLVEHGEIYLDPCNVTEDEATLAGEAIVEELTTARQAQDGCRVSWDEVKRNRAIAPLQWLE